MTRSLLILFVAFLFASTARGAGPVAGWWYAEGVEKGSALQYIVERRDDGSFTAKIRGESECHYDEPSEESGRWSYRDGILFNVTEVVAGHPVDGSSETYRDSFRVTLIDDDHQRLFDIKTHTEWIFRRVEAGFPFPSPLACTS